MFLLGIEAQTALRLIPPGQADSPDINDFGEISMRLKYIFTAGLFSLTAALSMGAQAAADTDKATEAKVPAETTQSDKTAPPKSASVEDKSDKTQKSATADPKKLSPYQDRSKHFHPRDK